MPARAAILLAALLFAGSCGGEGGRAGAAVPTAQPAPRGATIGPDGYATIADAPPAPFVPAEPSGPKPLTPEELARHQQFARAGRFQNEVRDEVQALAEKLRGREKGNFVDLYYENEGEPHVVFRFKRDPQKTLAKYTKHPRFFAETARYGREELRAAMDFMLEAFREDRIILGGGIGNKRNRAEIEIAITEPEFRSLAARKGVTIPEAVELKFAAKQPASEINRPLPPEIARLVRIFPRDNRPAGALHLVSSRAKLVLRDGCFHVAGGEHSGALVLFPLGAQLFIDRAGYLAFGPESPGYARVGETIVTPGLIAEVKAPELTGPIHDACGEGKVVKVHGLSSDAAEAARQSVQADAEALRWLRDSYGLPEATARKALERCKARSGFGACLISPPPPPPPGGPNCPPGTRASHGLCRTPEGYIRPIPKWIQDLTSD
jgi:hypothetical protein